MNRILVLLGTLSLLAIVAPLSAFSAGNGTVSAHVLAGISPCITISSPASGGAVDFGNLAFSPQASTQFSEGSGSPDITVASCATPTQTLLASGTDATINTLPAWTLATQLSVCTAASINTYRLGLRTGTTDLFLTTNNQTVATLPQAPAGMVTRTPRITMPCAGSSGSGQTETMTYNFTATIP